MDFIFSIHLCGRYTWNMQNEQKCSSEPFFPERVAVHDTIYGLYTYRSDNSVVIVLLFFMYTCWISSSPSTALPLPSTVSSLWPGLLCEADEQTSSLNKGEMKNDPASLPNNKS